MTDREFFYRTLGLSEPWEIVDVKLDLETKKVVVDLAVKPGTKWAEGGRLLPIVDYSERTWRHLDTMQLETVLRARVPRVRHPDGRTATVTVPWAGKGSRWTLDFEAFAIEVIKACASLSAAGRLLRLGWRSLDRIMARAVHRGLKRRELGAVKYLGLDEKSFRKRHRYGTLVNDLEAGRVLEVTESRTAEAAAAALDALGGDLLAGVEAAAIDMSPACERALHEKCPQAVVVYDRFHIAQLLGNAVDRVRREEHARLLKLGDDTLKGTRYDWLTDLDNMRTERLLAFEQLAERDLKTSRAWQHRILFQEFWEQPTAAKALDFFNKWFRRAVRSKLAPVVDASRTLKAHLQGLLNYFAHRITNALSEGLNSRIEAIKNSARGFHAFTSFRTRILFYLGALDLRPRQTQ